MKVNINFQPFDDSPCALFFRIKKYVKLKEILCLEVKDHI